MSFLLDAVNRLLEAAGIAISVSTPTRSDPSPLPGPEQRQTPEQAIQTALLLRQLLPAELVLLILDHAQLWYPVSQSFTNRKGAIIEEASHKIHLSLVIPPYIPRNAIRRIRFTTVSRDQGWSSYTADQGTYNGSWTWFEAAVAGLVDESSGAHTSDLGTQSTRTSPLEEIRGHGSRRLTSAEREPDLMRPQFYKYAPIKIITNVHAGRDYKTHVVEWDADNEDQDVRNMLKELQGGCRVDVAACARFPGWCNNVKSIKIEADCAVVRRM